MDNLPETELEKRFIKIYGLEKFSLIKDFIIENDILDFYLKARNKAMDLFNFGFHYGIIEIVAFCYCSLKLPIDINGVIDGYYKLIESSVEAIEIANGREVSVTQVPVETEKGTKQGIVIGTIDQATAWMGFTESRLNCIKYMIRMQKFSKYKIIKGSGNPKFIYQIVDKYVNSYKLLEVF